MYKVCYTYTNCNDDLNDCYQEIVVNLWKAYPKFRGECKLSTWIYRISINTAISFIRIHKKSPKTIPLIVNAHELEEDKNIVKEIKELYSLINRLGNIEKALILLWLEEKSYDEIAEITGISKTNVGVKIMRIKNKLKKMYNE